MTESEWLTSEDPQAMLAALRKQDAHVGISCDISDRKLRLFACALCRTRNPKGHWKGRVSDDLATYAYAERLAEGGKREFGFAEAYCFGLMWLIENNGLHAAERQVVSIDEDDSWGKNQAVELLREIVGNPFRPVAPMHHHEFGSSPWITPQVLTLARAAYEERLGKDCENQICQGRGKWTDEAGDTEECGECNGTGRIDDGTLDPFRLALLADALEEAGCIDQQILSHLRSPVKHVRGCWALDLILGKE